MTVLAHAGHWALSLLYVLPVFVVIVVGRCRTWRAARRARAADRDADGQHQEY